MIKLSAEKQDKGVKVTVESTGYTDKLVAEILSSIEGLMTSARNLGDSAYLAVLAGLVENPEWMSGNASEVARIERGED